ncbi:MAG: glycoside hydrolase family 32 protein [Acetatifactor sp.]|nr:glycoside hydrolase family 32 protein [Acetatifactor sp.]
MTRQKLHFTPPVGWTNDPNGLIFAGGKYHLFYQHYPHDTKWGPMHWGHAVSEDLLHWEYLPIALYPTEREYIFSGSAILDEEDLLGKKSGEQPAMVVFYTAHDPVTGEQMQCMAYSSDYVNFEKYAGNHIIENHKGTAEFKQDFRDPKVFRNPVLGGYSMILAVNDRTEFYHTADLVNWEYTGAFYHGEVGLKGLCECPDIYPLTLEGETKYVLTMSAIFTEEGASEESHVMQYFVGDFDGKRFVNPQEFDGTMLLDHGKDNYAMVTFANSPKPLALGWGEDWNDARRNTATEYFGKMTLARELSLVRDGEKIHLCQKPVWEPVEETEDLYCHRYLLEVGEKRSLACKIPIENAGDHLVIGDKRIPRSIAGPCTVQEIYDTGYLEVFTDEGRIAYSANV